MKASFYQEQINQLLQMIEDGQGHEADTIQTIPTSQFRDAERLAREKALFKRMPLMVAHSSEMEQPGDFVVRELGGTSWLLVRGQDGVARAFYNYCQHRGTKLVHEQSGSSKRRFTCPYHAWTYSNQGELVALPRADLFPQLCKSEKGLKSANLQEAYGFLWLTQDGEAGQPIDEYLGGLRAEFSALELANHHVYFDKTRSLNANWKLPLFAFLESYHLSVLHTQSIGEFFIENIAISEVMEPHIRSFVPRKNVHELAEANLDEVNIADYITPTNIVFPNVCMIAHPTSISIISMFPGATPDTCSWRHQLLIPEPVKSDAQRAHYDKTIAVLDEITYEKEDFWVSAMSQEGINAGALEELTLGKTEYMLKVYNDMVEKYS